MALVSLFLMTIKWPTKIIEPLRPTQENSIAMVYRTAASAILAMSNPVISLDFTSRFCGRIKFGGPFDKTVFTLLSANKSLIGSSHR